jgi:hypothetical protein
VANSGVITALDGDASQYVRGDGTLADFPTSTGGGSSVSYYLNSSVSQGTIGGVAYRQLSKTPISGAGTDIAISSNGYVASYITDANDPALLEVPAGNFNCEFYFSVNSNAHNPYVYAELYKYDGTTFTLLGSNQAIPDYLSNGTTLSAYYFAIPVAVAALTITDRIAIRIYVNVDGRVVTLHTENNHLCQVVTTFSKGLTSLNNLTRQVQFLATGTSGTDFNIVSSVATHTFNIPDASATNRGLITTGSQTIAGAKVFDNPITANSGIGFLNGVMPNISSNLYSGIGGNSQGISIITRPVSTNYTNNFYFPSASNSYTFPNATGTLALTSDISYPVTSVFGRTGAVIATSGDYNTSQVTENTNLYFTDARARAALSAGTGISYNNTTGVITSTITQYTDALARASLSFTAGSGAYNSTTGVITIPTDNNQIANGAGYITSSALSGYLPLSGGTLTGGLNGTTATFSGLGTFYQLTMTGATAGRLFYAQTGGVFSQSGNLVWNNSTEQLGVGTPNPSAVVTAFSTNAATQLKAAGTAPAITFSNTLTSASLACVFGLATANNHFVTGTAAGDMAIANQSTSPGAIIFGTGTFEKMRMTSAGTFSIGNTNSTYNLDVTGTGRFTSTLLLGGALSGTSATFSGSGLFGGSTNAGNAGTFTLSVGVPGTTAGGLQLWAATNQSSFLQFGDGTSAADNYRGYVGYNHATDALTLGSAGADRLTIASTGAATFSSRVTANDFVFTGTGAVLQGVVSAGNNSQYGYFQNTGGVFYFGKDNIFGSEFGTSAYSAVLWNTGNNPIVFATANTQKMTILGNGNVGIGTSSPSKTLTVSASVAGEVVQFNNTRNAGGSAYVLVTALGSNDNNTSNYHYIAATGAGDKMYVYGNGNIVNVNNSYGTLSDATLKENIVDATPKLDNLLKLKVRNFNLIDDENKTKQIGFIAQEFEEVFPSMIDIDGKSGKKLIKTSVLVPMLVKAIQELTQKVKEQQAQIEELKAKIK